MTEDIRITRGALTFCGYVNLFFAYVFKSLFFCGVALVLFVGTLWIDHVVRKELKARCKDFDKEK